MFKKNYLFYKVYNVNIFMYYFDIKEELQRRIILEEYI